MQKKTLTIRVGEEQLKLLREIAKAEDRSLSGLIRRFIDDSFNARKIKRGVGLQS